jgi:mono/diheme cytochrome c family protein
VNFRRVSFLGATCLLHLLGSVASAGAEEPHTNYLLHCAGCHGLDGRGVPPVVPTLREEPGRIASVPGGRDYLVRVPGVAQAALSDADLAGVVNYVLTAFSAATLGKDVAPFTAEEVAQYRSRLLANPQQRREEIWRRY